jgi:hypothetical protein
MNPITTQQEMDLLAESFKTGGVDSTLEALDTYFKAEKKFHELFEILKMKVRRKLGLPIVYDENSVELDEEVRNQLEDGLLEACKEAGTGLLQDGKIREGWMYLRPIGDRAYVEALIRDIPVSDSHLDELIEVCVSEGVSPGYGFSLVLEHYGTCNSITAFETQIAHLPKSDQETAAEQLVSHLHAELVKNLKDVVGQQEGSAPSESSIKALVEDRDWLFGEMTYHIDTTHLASVVRFARVIQSEPCLRLALDLTEYGRRLHSQFQYPGEEPFAEIYPSSALYFQALLGDNLDAAIEYFKEKAESTDAYHQGTASIEVYIDLLARCGRLQDAIESSVRLLPAGTRTVGIAPSLYELSKKVGDFSRMMEVCRQNEDVLGFATALMQNQP